MSVASVGSCGAARQHRSASDAHTRTPAHARTRARAHLGHAQRKRGHCLLDLSAHELRRALAQVALAPLGPQRNGLVGVGDGELIEAAVLLAELNVRGGAVGEVGGILGVGLARLGEVLHGEMVVLGLERSVAALLRLLSARCRGSCGGHVDFFRRDRENPVPRRASMDLVRLAGLAFLLFWALRLSKELVIRFLLPPADFSRFKGRWAVVTGASAGIGAGYCRALARRG